jgi:hypothetical protein
MLAGPVVAKGRVRHAAMKCEIMKVVFLAIPGLVAIIGNIIRVLIS